ncbi:hypothetical protein SMM_0883 [Spiroplasma mirum ATCC 29335]|nr:hypothetical protein SMM_0883 [Spiroplasma mirum ATCC 29335]
MINAFSRYNNLKEGERMEVVIQNLNGTDRLAKIFSQHVKPNHCILLTGELAAGKTTFTKQLLKYLDVQEPVTSPTFVILNEYLGRGGLKINHMDSYRLLGLDFTEEWDQYLDEFADSLNIIEWPDIIAKYLDAKYELIHLTITFRDEETRLFTIETNNQALLQAIRKEFL